MLSELLLGGRLMLVTELGIASGIPSTSFLPPATSLSIKCVFVQGSLLFVTAEAGCLSCEPAGKGVSPERGTVMLRHSVSQAGFLGW